MGGATGGAEFSMGGRIFVNGKLTDPPPEALGQYSLPVIAHRPAGIMLQG